MKVLSSNTGQTEENLRHDKWALLKKDAKRSFKQHWQLYLIILIPIIYIIVFKYMPMVGAQIAFKDYRAKLGIWGSSWVGFKHFENFFNSPYFVSLLKNTLALSISTLIISFPMPIILAIMLNEVKNTKFKKTVQMITYAPYFISTVVLVSIMLQVFSLRTGIVNQVIQFFGADPINFMGESQYFRGMYILSSVWQGTGYSAIIFIAALAGVDQTLYEAAVVDGATRWQKIIHIDIPALIPTIVIMLIMNVGRIMSIGFEKVYLMQTPLNKGSSEIIATYVYNIGLVGGQYSYSTAIDLFNAIINFIMLVSVNFIAKKISDTSLW